MRSRRGGIGPIGRMKPAQELVDGALAVAAEQRPRVVAKRLLDLRRDAADDPEVDVADQVAVEQQDVGGVQVAMKDATRVDLAEEVPDDVGGGLVEVVPGREQPLAAAVAVGAQLADDVDERHAFEALGGEHAAGREVEVDLRGVLGGRVADLRADLDGVLGLDGVVELLARPARELVDDLPASDRAQQAGAVQERGGAAHERDVAHEQRADAGPLHLDRDPPAVAQDRAVHLPDRRAAEGVVVERCEQLRRRPSELVADHPLDL